MGACFLLQKLAQDKTPDHLLDQGKHLAIYLG